MSIRGVARCIRDYLFFKSNNHLTTYSLYLISRMFRNRFITTKEFLLACHDWVNDLPHEYDLIIGIPRTGMIPATLAAVHLNLPLATPDGFLQGRMYNGKFTKKKQIRRVLVVDDSIAAGVTITNILTRLKKTYPHTTFKIGCPFGMRRSTHLNNHPGVEIGTTIFEFDIMHFKPEKVGTDMDGVLCEDPPKGINQENLVLHYRNANPLNIPSYKLDFIATGREEKHRKVTEAWLKKHGIKYAELIMRKPGETAERTKAQAILTHKPYWFWESNKYSAVNLHLRTGCRVLSFEEMRLYG